MNKRRHRTDPAAAWASIDIKPRAETNTPASADIHIYAAIGEDAWGDGISAADFANQISDLDVDVLNVYINSPGGAAWDGIAIMNALRRHRAHVNITVDALAASAASVIVMAGDHVTMNRGAELMIHDASGWVWGNADACRDTAAILDKLSDSYADAYAARAGGDRDYWRAAMRAETWYTAEEAVAAGLADEWVDAPSKAATAAFDRSSFRYPTRAAAPAPAVAAFLASLVTKESTATDRKEHTMSDSLLEGLRQRLGLADADADESVIFAAVDTLVSAADKAPTIPEGTTLIDASALAELRAAAAAGEAAIAAADAKRRDDLVDSAIAEGRIAPASRAAFREMADKDEAGTAALLASMAPNTVPVAEVGSGIDKPAAQAEDDALYHAAFGSKEMN